MLFQITTCLVLHSQETGGTWIHRYSHVCLFQRYGNDVLIDIYMFIRLTMQLCVYWFIYESNDEFIQNNRATSEAGTVPVAGVTLWLFASNYQRCLGKTPLLTKSARWYCTLQCLISPAITPAHNPSVWHPHSLRTFSQRLICSMHCASVKLVTWGQIKCLWPVWTIVERRSYCGLERRRSTTGHFLPNVWGL